MIDYKKFEGTVVSLAICDDISGFAEFIEDAGDKIKVQWITASACYSCQVYPEETYTEVSEYDKESIYEIKESTYISRADSGAKREQSIAEDAYMFERYNNLRKSVSK